MKATIASHLAMIDQMQGWEAEHDRTLSADDSADTAR